MDQRKFCVATDPKEWLGLKIDPWGRFLKKLSWGVALHRFERSLGRSVIENVFLNVIQTSYVA
jgi:hypothetical protein